MRRIFPIKMDFADKSLQCLAKTKDLPLLTIQNKKVVKFIKI